MLSLRSMQVASCTGESLGHVVAKRLPQCRNVFARQLGELGEIKKEWQQIAGSRVVILKFLHVTARMKEESSLVEGDDPGVLTPKNLPVPVDVNVFTAFCGQEGFQQSCCMFGGAVAQSLVGALVGGHPCWFAGTWDKVLVFVLGLPCSHAALGICL